MRRTELIMDMPVTVVIDDANATPAMLDAAFEWFRAVDARFSVFKHDSEISRINRGELEIADSSDDMREVLGLCADTTRQTDGFFDIRRADGTVDPSGIVKGWAIHRAACLLEDLGCAVFSVDAGGDMELRGRTWDIGIRNPFKNGEIVKTTHLRDCGIATSGNYIRGDHIYDPHARGKVIDDIVSLTVIGPNVYEADRFATAAFAMGRAGIGFIERTSGLEGYMIDADGIATMTTGFADFTA